VFTDPGETNINYLALETGHGQLQDFEDIKLYYNPNYGGILGGVMRLFGNNCSAGTVFIPQWRDGRKPTPGNPDTWMRLHIHLAENVAPPVLWDMCYNSSTNEANYAMNVTALSIDASADGVSWQEVAATNNIVHLNTAAHCWLSNPPTTEWASSAVNYPERQSHPNKFTLAATKQQGTYARPTPRSVYVCSGATLRNESATDSSVSNLVVDVSGSGTLEGFDFASNGVLTINGLSPSAPMEQVLVIPADFSGVPGYASLNGWQVEIPGRPSTRYKIAGVTASGIRLSKPGTTILFR
jgi:hypothetical protein